MERFSPAVNVDFPATHSHGNHTIVKVFESKHLLTALTSSLLPEPCDTLFRTLVSNTEMSPRFVNKLNINIIIQYHLPFPCAINLSSTRRGWRRLPLIIKREKNKLWSRRGDERGRKSDYWSCAGRDGKNRSGHPAGVDTAPRKARIDLTVPTQLCFQK